MPAKATRTKEVTTEVEVEKPRKQPVAATLAEALDQQAAKYPTEPATEPGIADASEFEPVDDDDVPPTEVSSTDERPVSE